MIEAMIEYWSDLGGAPRFRWSLWRDGHRIAVGDSAFASAEACQGDAEGYCRVKLGCRPDRVTRL